MKQTTKRAGRVKPARSARLAGAFLTISEGKKVTNYHLAPLASEIGGVAYRFTKLLQDGGEVYETQADPATGHGHCCCPGSLRWGHCRHVEVLVALRKAGRI
jgi:hypothetical protein